MSTDATLTANKNNSTDHELVKDSLRIGQIDFLNTYPMYYALGIEPTKASAPTDINRWIADAEIDAACMSAIEYARHADDLVLLPSMCVSANGAVGSIFAICNTPFEEVKDVWVTPQTATSVVLAQLLWNLRSAKPTLHLLEDTDTPDKVLSGGENRAVLLIGDNALKARSEASLAKYAFVDLGERWLAETGLPMVYAVWAVRRDAMKDSNAAAIALDHLLTASVTQFFSDDDKAIDAAVERYGVDHDSTRSYFDTLSYDFGKEERKGLVRYLRMAQEQGLLGAVPTPEFIELDTPIEKDTEAGSDATDTTLISPDIVRSSYLKTVGSSRALDENAADDEHIMMCLDMEADARKLDIDVILQKALNDERISELDALALLQSERLVEVGQVAHALRLKRTPAADVSFVIDRNINYTNYCITDCGFCAFYRKPGDDVSGGYLHTTETLLEKIRETIALNGTAALLQGGHNPDLDIQWYEDLFRAVKQEFPTFHLHALSPPEIQHISRRSKMSIPDVLSRLRDAGMDTLPGGGGEVLIDRVRRVIAPKKTKSADWLDIMRIAQRMGISTTASLMYGHTELLAERVLHLQRIRELQDETRGFRAFTSWSFQPGGTALGRAFDAGVVPYQRYLPPTPTPFTYLLTQAVGRIYLDNLDNVQASWVTQGMKVGQAALMFGANDLGSIMMEENVVSSAGTTYHANTDDFVHAIQAIGFNPVQRDTLYREVKRY